MDQQRQQYGGGAEPVGRAGREDAGGTMQDATSTAKDKAAEYGARVQEQADAGIDAAAEGVGKAASKVREQAARQDGMAGQAGVKVADGMEKTAGYLREHDTDQILDDVEQYVREHPMQAVAGAVVGGFLIGRILR
jgi:ElaB/YqjD/DUF883 family membrane-anchored ribosome-binding protein